MYKGGSFKKVLKEGWIEKESRIIKKWRKLIKNLIEKIK